MLLLHPGHTESPTIQLMWVEQFKYLGIQVGRDPARFSDLNVLPMLFQHQEKCARWVSLPLNLLGCINLLKINFLPKFLYVNCSQIGKINANSVVDGCYQTLGCTSGPLY